MAYEVKQPILGFENVQRVILDRHDGITFCLRNSDDNEYMKLFLIAANTPLEELNLPIGMQTILDLRKNSKYSIYFPVVKAKNVYDSVINVGAPFVFNEDTGVVAQCIISNEQHTITELFGEAE